MSRIPIQPDAHRARKGLTCDVYQEPIAKGQRHHRARVGVYHIDGECGERRAPTNEAELRCDRPALNSKIELT